MTEDQRFACEVTRSFLDAEQSLTAARGALQRAQAFDPALWKRVAALGWTSLLAPEALGGGSLSDRPLVDLTVIAAELGRAVGPGPVLETNIAVDALVRSPNTELRDRHLPELLEGAAVVGWCVDHRGWLRGGGTLASRRIPGGVVLSGHAVATIPCSSALLLVSTPTVTCLVEGGDPGVARRPLKWLDPTTRHAVVTFDDVTIADTAVVSDDPDELERQSRLAWVLQAAELTGVVDAVFATTLRWLADRYSFGRPLASYQALKHRCADMKTWVEASHAIADAAAEAVGTGADDAGLVARAAKSYAATRAVELIQDCIQLHGGIGVTWEHDLHLYLRRATMIANTYARASELWDAVAAAELGRPVAS